MRGMNTLVRFIAIGAIAVAVGGFALSNVAKADRILIDFGHSTNQTPAGPDAYGQHWNNFAPGDGPAAWPNKGTKVVNNATDASTGLATAIDLRLTSYWDNQYWGYTSTYNTIAPAADPLPTTGNPRVYPTISGPTAYNAPAAAVAAAALQYPDSAVADAMVITSIGGGNTGFAYAHSTWHLTDLDPSKKYTLKMFDGANNIRGSYWEVLGDVGVGGIPQSFVNGENNTSLIIFPDVVPDANNEIRINWRKTSESQFVGGSQNTNFWNVLEIESSLIVPEPASMALVAIAFLSCAVSRRQRNA